MDGPAFLRLLQIQDLIEQLRIQATIYSVCDENVKEQSVLTQLESLCQVRVQPSLYMTPFSMPLNYLRLMPHQGSQLGIKREASSFMHNRHSTLDIMHT